MYFVATETLYNYKSLMYDPSFNDYGAAVKPTKPGWCYRRPKLGGVIEMVTHRGPDIGLAAHFHNEDQIVFAVSGRRRFLINGEIVTLLPGKGFLIRAGVLHRSLAEQKDVECLNVFTPASEYAVSAMMREAERQWNKVGQLCCTEFAAIVCDHRIGFMPSSQIGSEIQMEIASYEPVIHAAAREGISRGSFYKRFTKQYGIPPHMYSIIARLNHARVMLRAGESISSVAVNAGFVDQSHLGRWFRNTFGITPGRYRSSLLESKMYQNIR